ASRAWAIVVHMIGVRTGSASTPAFFVTFFFFNDTATTEIYTLSLHDALPIYHYSANDFKVVRLSDNRRVNNGRSEEHTSELQSLTNLVCRLLLEKKKKKL